MGRGPSRFITYAEIARVSGRSLRTVMADAHPRVLRGRKVPARYDPQDLQSLLRYLLRSRRLRWD